MNRTASAIGVLAVLCLTTSLITAPASAQSPEPDHEVPATLQLSSNEMAAFAALDGAEVPTAWGSDASASYVVTAAMAQTDPLQFSNPYDSQIGTGPVDPTSTASAAAAPKIIPIFCRASMDLPHSSHTTARTINTHLVGKCDRTPLSHSISGATYRQFWFGWGIQTSGVATNSKINQKLVLPFRCHYNQWGLYRTNGRYYSAFSNGWRGISYREMTAHVQCR